MPYLEDKTIIKKENHKNFIPFATSTNKIFGKKLALLCMESLMLNVVIEREYRELGFTQEMLNQQMRMVPKDHAMNEFFSTDVWVPQKSTDGFSSTALMQIEQDC